MHVVVFIDNEAARICILKGYSKNDTISSMAHAVSLLEEECCCFPWYARVPSEANIAAAPSRSVDHSLLCKGHDGKSLSHVVAKGGGGHVA